jgi:hypothetical protein
MTSKAIRMASKVPRMTSEAIRSTSEVIRVTSEVIRVTSEAIRMTSKVPRMTSKVIRMTSEVILDAMEADFTFFLVLANDCSDRGDVNPFFAAKLMVAPSSNRGPPRATDTRDSRTLSIARATANKSAQKCETMDGYFQKLLIFKASTTLETPL